MGWYLNLIEDRVEEFLVQNGFHQDALPFRYLDEKPKSLPLLHDNLQIIRNMILFTQNDIYQVKAKLLQPLMDQVYEKLEEFLEISQELVEFLSSSSSSHPEIQSLLKDVEYVLEMKRIEEDDMQNYIDGTKKPQKGGPLSDIVPVSGLILGKLHRIENEFKTAIEHWSPRMRH